MNAKAKLDKCIALRVVNLILTTIGIIFIAIKKSQEFESSTSFIHHDRHMKGFKLAPSTRVHFPIA